MRQQWSKSSILLWSTIAILGRIACSLVNFKHSTIIADGYLYLALLMLLYC